MCWFNYDICVCVCVFIRPSTTFLPEILFRFLRVAPIRYTQNIRYYTWVLLVSGRCIQIKYVSWMDGIRNILTPDENTPIDREHADGRQAVSTTTV